LDEKIHALILRLLGKAMIGKVNWQEGPNINFGNGVFGKEYAVTFPNAIIAIAMSNCWLPNQRQAIFVLRALNGRTLQELKFQENDSGFRNILELYHCAEQFTTPITPIVDEIIDTLKKFATVGLTPQEMQKQFTKSFFLKIAGVWRLKHEVSREKISREEELRIDTQGNCYTRPKKKMFMKNTSIETLAFTLQRVIYDPVTNHVSFDKVDTGNIDPVRFPKDHVWQREVLDLTANGNAMVGYAEHDRHMLNYVRLQH
jgi:hypothetical protein